MKRNRDKTGIGIYQVCYFYLLSFPFLPWSKKKVSSLLSSSRAESELDQLRIRFWGKWK